MEEIDGMDEHTGSLRESEGIASVGFRVNPITAWIARSVGTVASRSVKKFIFVASTGRSGTKSLWKVFDSVPQCAAFHEVYPRLHGKTMIDSNCGDSSALVRAFWMRKLPTILLSARGSRWYVETSHIFIKSYAEEAVKFFGDRLAVIHLVRDANAVALSLLARGAVPGTPYGSGWCLAPSYPGNLIQIEDTLSAKPFDHPFFRCLWYWYEIEARTARFRCLHPNVCVYDYDVEAINNGNSLKLLFGALGMDVDVSNGCIEHENASPTPPRMPVGIDAARVDQFHEVCKELLRDITS